MRNIIHSRIVTTHRNQLVSLLLTKRSQLFRQKFKSFHNSSYLEQNWHRMNARIERVSENGTDTIILHPSLGKHSASLVLLHGLGDSCDGLSSVGEAIQSQFPHVKIIIPTATQNPVTINNRMRMNSWYDITGFDENSSGTCEGIEDSKKRIEGYLEQENSLGVPYSRMVLAGFSQGGALVLFTGLQLRPSDKLGGLVVLSSYLPGHSKFNLTDGLGDTPILHCHGKMDPVVIYSWAEKSKEHLEQRGVSSYTLKLYDDVMHSISQAMIVEVQSFLSAILPADESFVVKVLAPKNMSIKQLKEGIRQAGLLSEAKGFMEKQEFVSLLQDYYTRRGIATAD